MKRWDIALLVTFIIGGIALVFSIQRYRASGNDSAGRPELRVAIAPYQDLAMLVNVEPLGLGDKYKVNVSLVTMSWEDILPALASRGRTVDVGFGSLIEYLTKYHRLNTGVSDPLLFVQPLYVYKGGGFVAMDPSVPVVDATALQDRGRVAEFLQLRFGAQKQSLYEMMLFTVARRAGVSPSSLKVSNISMNDGLLALQSESLDATAAGLTQLNEVKKHGGRLVLSMEDVGFVDIVGFICRKSTLDSRRVEIEAVIRSWFECVDYVFADLSMNSHHSLAYLRRNAATEYTFDEYAAALSQEFFPRSLDSLRSELLQPGAKYELLRVANEVTAYLLANDLIPTAPPVPQPLIQE